MPKYYTSYKIVYTHCPILSFWQSYEVGTKLKHKQVIKWQSEFEHRAL